jgi:effector-binding domain-containing protein
MCPEYEEFGAQLKKLKREGWNNHWSEIHNFTKKEGEIHYTLHRHPSHEMEVNWEKAFDEAGVKEVAK